MWDFGPLLEILREEVACMFLCPLTGFEEGLNGSQTLDEGASEKVSQKLLNPYGGQGLRMSRIWGH